jgi:hypothetical protein
MYNDKNRQNAADMHHGRAARMPIGRSRPAFAEGNGEAIGSIPRVDERIGKRLCDGTLPDGDLTDRRGECGDGDAGFGLRSHPLAMVYSPLQEFHELYSPEKALERGTLFSELDLPFEGGKKGVCL